MKYLASNNLFAYTDDILGADSPPNTRSDQRVTSSVSIASSLYLVTFFKEADEEEQEEEVVAAVGKRLPSARASAHQQGSSRDITIECSESSSPLSAAPRGNHKHLVGIKIASDRRVYSQGRYRTNSLQRQVGLGDISCSTSDGEEDERQLLKQSPLLQESLAQVNLSVNQRLGYWSANFNQDLNSSEQASRAVTPNDSNAPSHRKPFSSPPLTSSSSSTTDLIPSHLKHYVEEESDSFLLVRRDGGHNYRGSDHSSPPEPSDSSDDGWVIVETDINKRSSSLPPQVGSKSNSNLAETGRNSTRTKTTTTTTIDHESSNRPSTTTTTTATTTTTTTQKVQTVSDQRRSHITNDQHALGEQTSPRTIHQSRRADLPRRFPRTLNSRQAQMALDKTDLDLIRVSWVPVRMDPTSHALQLFRGLFTKFPKYLAFFPQFSDLDLDKMGDNKRLVRHAVKVIDAVTFVVDSVGIESKADELNTTLVNLVKGHLRRRIGLTEFRNLGVVIIDFICDVNQRRLVPQSGTQTAEQIERRCSLATVTPNSSMVEVDGLGQRSSLAKSASTAQSDSGNMSSASGDIEMTMTSALDKIQTSSTPSSSSEDDSLKANQQSALKSSSLVDRRSSELAADSHRHVGKLDTNALVAAWTKLYSCILDLVKREEEDQAARLDDA